MIDNKDALWSRTHFEGSKMVNVDIMHDATVTLYINEDIKVEDFEECIFRACYAFIDYKRKHMYEILAKRPMWSSTQDRVYRLPPTDRYAIREINRDWPSDSESESETLSIEEEESEHECGCGTCDCELIKK